MKKKFGLQADCSETFNITCLTMRGQNEKDNQFDNSSDDDLKCFIVM